MPIAFNANIIYITHKGKTNKRKDLKVNSNVLKTYRIKQKITQKQFADKAGVDQSQISRWESGANPIPKWIGILIKCWKENSKQ
jgi:DNA-binding XRE family transcriptional regulator